MKLGRFEINNIYCEDSYKAIKDIPDKSIDCIYTDIPYLYNQGGSGNSELGERTAKKRLELMGAGTRYLQEKNTSRGEELKIAKNKIKQHIDFISIEDGINYEILDDFVRIMKKINIFIWCSKLQILDIMKYFIDKNDKKSTETKEKKTTDKKSTGIKEKKSTKTKSKKNKQKTKDTGTNKGAEYYPTVDVIDEIGERLVNVDYVMDKLTESTPEEDYRYIWKRKSTENEYLPSYFYSNIWLNTIQKYKQENALSALEEYAKDNALEITNCIDIVYWASKKEEEGNWQRLSSRLVILLKGGEIPTLDEVQQLGELQEQNDLVSDSYED